MKKLLKKNIISSSILNVLQLLPFSFKRKGILTTFLLILNSLIDLIGLGSLIPLFLLIMHDNALQEYPLLNKIFVLSGLENYNHFALAICCLIFLLTIIKNIASISISHYVASFAFSLYKYFAAKSLDFYYKKGFLYFKSNNSTQIVRNVNVIPSNFAHHMILPLMNLLNEILILILIASTLIAYDPKAIMILALIITPAFLIFYRYAKRKIKKYDERLNELTPIINNNLFQSIFGYVDVIISDTKRFFLKKYHLNIDEVATANVKSYTLKVAPTKVIETSLIAGIVALVIYGIIFLDDRRQLITMLGLCALAAYRVLPSINRIMLALLSIKGYQYTFEYLAPIKDYEIDLTDQIKPLRFDQKIKVKNLSFVYPNSNDYVIKDISFEISKGEVLGIVGTSGTGKSTLMNLLLGFLPSVNQIFVDDVSLNVSNLPNWQKLIGYVQQDVYLIDGTIEENIAFGVEPHKFDKELMSKVIDRSSLRDFIGSLPDKEKTLVGERGSRLSGGQRQRIGIARALYKGSEILFFDEATSSLDMQTEKEITESIQALSDSNLTIIVISHRITSLKYCSRIMKMERGNIIGTFSYDTLLKQEDLKKV